MDFEAKKKNDFFKLKKYFSKIAQNVKSIYEFFYNLVILNNFSLQYMVIDMEPPKPEIPISVYELSQGAQNSREVSEIAIKILLRTLSKVERILQFGHVASRSSLELDLLTLLPALLGILDGMEFQNDEGKNLHLTSTHEIDDVRNKFKGIVLAQEKNFLRNEKIR